MQEGALKDLVIAVERTKAQIRSRVEHPFDIVKHLFHHRKTRYKGLAKTPRNCSACSLWQIW
jgi:IS5 family transposase